MLFVLFLLRGGGGPSHNIHSYILASSYPAHHVERIGNEHWGATRPAVHQMTNKKQPLAHPSGSVCYVAGLGGLLVGPPPFRPPTALENAIWPCCRMAATLLWAPRDQSSPLSHPSHIEEGWLRGAGGCLPPRELGGMKHTGGGPPLPLHNSHRQQSA